MFHLVANVTNSVATLWVYNGVFYILRNIVTYFKDLQMSTLNVYKQPYSYVFKYYY
jgi:hypothetical protein